MGNENNIKQVNGQNLSQKELQKLQNETLLAKAAYANFADKITEKLSNPKIAKDNELHHKSPTELTRHTYWYNINGSIQYSALIAAILFLLSTHIVLCLGFFFLGFANLVHRFSHETRHRIPSLIRILQWSGVFISPDHHVIHHVDGRMLVSKKRAHREFCVMSNLLNPLLDKMKLWRRLERLVSLFGYDPI